jgi:hypothetical protein
MKVRQVLPTLPKSQQSVPRFQDDDSPPGYKIRWHLLNFITAAINQRKFHEIRHLQPKTVALSQEL